MNKQGFTLIELLAVITILGILFTFLIPKLLGVIESAERKAFAESVEIMIDAAKKYMSSPERTIPLPVDESGEYNAQIITIDFLKEQGLMKKSSNLDGSIVAVVNINDEYRYFAYATNGKYDAYGIEEGNIYEDVYSNYYKVDFTTYFPQGVSYCRYWDPDEPYLNWCSKTIPDAS